jgi:hypothetical protein
MPAVAPASRSRGGTAAKALRMGCTAKGRFTSTEASSNPPKEKASPWPKTACQARPRGEWSPKAVSR